MKKWRWIFVIFVVVGFVFVLGLSYSYEVYSQGRIAVLVVKGTIMEAMPFTKKLEKFKESSVIRAVVIRVDSPGGSVGASQELYRAIERVRKSGKPVVVSMGNMAASGGYYVSAPANFIFANPGTITGSIGVIIQHVNYGELARKLGIKTTFVKTGKFKDILSPFRELTPEEKEYLQNTIEEAYEQFLTAILKYRKEKISEEKLRKVADGRVITGQNAKELGLVDGIGNLQDAIEKARELSRSPQARVVFYEESKSFLARLLGSELSETLESFNIYSPLLYIFEWQGGE